MEQYRILPLSSFLIWPEGSFLTLANIFRVKKSLSRAKDISLGFYVDVGNNMTYGPIPQFVAPYPPACHHPVVW